MGDPPGAGTLRGCQVGATEAEGLKQGVLQNLPSPLASDPDTACDGRTTQAGSLGELLPQTALFVCVSCTRYFLQPRDNGSKSLKPEDLGSLRLNVVYTEDHVFSSDYYSPLRDLLLRSADVEVPAWLAHHSPHLGPAVCSGPSGSPSAGEGSPHVPRSKSHRTRHGPRLALCLTVTPGSWPSAHRPRCRVWVRGGRRRPAGRTQSRGLGLGLASFMPCLPSPSQRLRPTSWARSAGRSRRRPSRWCGSSYTTAGWCPSSVPSPVPRSGGPSECQARPETLRGSGLFRGWTGVRSARGSHTVRVPSETHLLF